MSETIVIL